MSKLSYEDKIEIYKANKNGISQLNLSKKYNVKKCVIQYLICLIDKHGIDILRTTKNKKHSRLKKEEAINRVLIKKEAAWSVAIDIGLLSYGMIQNWISKYKENGYNIVERKRGRSPTMSKEKLKPKKMKQLKKKMRD